jgi:hypothetical protein
MKRGEALIIAVVLMLGSLANVFYYLIGPHGKNAGLHLANGMIGLALAARILGRVKKKPPGDNP